MMRAVASSRRALLVTLALAGGALAVAVLVVLLLGRDGLDSPPPASPARSDYVEGVIGAWQRINPLFASENAVDEDLSRLVFAGLVRAGPDGRLLPDLAPLPTVSEDGLTYTFRLHPGLRWHDGAPLRSLDVDFTIEQILAPDFRGPPELTLAWTGVEVRTPDLRTVVFRLPAPSASFLARFATIGILPEHLLQGLDGAALFDSPFNARPVGAGPYRIESLTSTEAALRGYARYHFGRPELDTLAIRFLPDFPAAQRALEAREIDGILLRQSLHQAQLDALGQIEGFVREDLQRSVSLVLYLNSGQAAYFGDVRVRTAISLALDREALVEDALLGLATPSASAIAPGTWAYAPSFDSLPSDPEPASALLAEAGWHRSPITGVLVRQGSEFRLTIRTDDNPRHVALAREIARQLEPLGVRATVASTSFTVLRRDFLDMRTYDAALTGWDQGADPDPYFAWHSSQARPPGGNVASYGGIVVDALLERGRTHLDRSVRIDTYTQFQEVWRREAPSVIIAYPRYRYVRTDALDAPALGVLFNPADRFLDVHEWRIA